MDEEEKPPQCEFSFDPDEDSDLNRRVVFSELSHTWRCPQYADKEHNGEHLCLFHLPTSEKQAQEVQQRFVECVTQEGAGVKQFVGAKFEHLSIVHSVLGSNDNSPIDLRHATFKGDITLSGSTIAQPVYLTGSTVRGMIQTKEATFTDSLWAQHIEVEGGIASSSARFHSTVNFRNSKIHTKAKFNNCRFNEEASFYGCEFNTAEDYSPSDPVREQSPHQPVRISLSGSTFSEGANFNSAEFNGHLNCKHVTSEDIFRLSDVDLVGKALSEWYIPPDMDLDFGEKQDYHEVAVINGKFEGLQIRPGKLADGPCVVSLEGANIESGVLAHGESERIYYDFEGATLGDVQLREMDQGKDWEYLIFNKTDIDGLNFLNYRTALRECDYDICRIYDSDDLIDKPDTPAKKNTYLKARIGADSVRAYKASSEFHIHELDTLLTQLKDDQEWIQYAIYRLYSITSRYGEKPGRVITVFTPLLLLSYLAARVIPTPSIISGTSGLLLTVLPPIFSGLLVLASSRYIGD